MKDYGKTFAGTKSPVHLYPALEKVVVLREYRPAHTEQANVYLKP